jgi:uncharacterized ferredoxin-like protein
MTTGAGAGCCDGQEEEEEKTEAKAGPKCKMKNWDL